MFRYLHNYFLLAALILSSLLFTLPLITYLPESGKPVVFGLTGIQNAPELPAGFSNNFWALPFLGVVIVLLLFVVLLLWNRKDLQMRLAVFTAVLFLGLEGMMVFFAFQIPFVLDYSHRTFHVSIVFPLVGFLLTVLAIRGIRKTELLELAGKHFRPAGKP